MSLAKTVAQSVSNRSVLLRVQFGQFSSVCQLWPSVQSVQSIMLSQILVFGHLIPKNVIFAQKMLSSPQKGNLSKISNPAKITYFGQR